jgi:hypothetical protein
LPVSVHSLSSHTSRGAAGSDPPLQDSGARRRGRLAHPVSGPATAAAVLGVLALHAAHKLEHGLIGEMLWACHVASLLIATGILTRQIWLVAVGTVFHLAVGVPACALDVIVLQQTTVTSVLVHVVPPLAGLLALRTEAPWPRWTPIAAVALYVALIPLSRWLTEPALNVNLAFAPWPPLATVSTSPWITWLGNVAWMAVLVPIFDRWIRGWSGPFSAGGPTHGR